MASILALLSFAACPLAMGTGMWLLMRMTQRRQGVSTAAPEDTAAADQEATGIIWDDPVERLRAQLRTLAHRQAAAQEQIEQLRDHEQTVTAGTGPRGSRV